MLEASIELARDVAHVAVARQFVGQTLADWGLGPLRDSALLITSELSTNAVLHAGTDFQVTLQSDGAGHLRIEVRDNSDRMPALGPLGSGAAGGRGLAIVAALAASWEARADGDGKVVRAELRL